ncbi:hypothetical protein [uncultured Lacinutrix sp.]|uniref:hypothetical protein n=1 Tax=uncultured Lacinutrix sp. TaxID=574032 RepID=UPI002611BFF9|nr:hypothetical protein [uncultured Lacinutrix sp.]
MDYLKENITWEVIVLAFILSIIYDLLKKIFFWLVETSSKVAKWKSNRNILSLIKFYKVENEHIEKIVKKDEVFLKKAAKELIYDSIFGFTIFILLLILNNIERRILFYGVLGSCFILLLKVFSGFVYYIKLFYKAKYHKKFIKINKQRISKLEKILSSEL